MVAAPHAALHVETHRAVLFPGPQDVKGASEGLQFAPQAHAVSSEFAARVIPVGLFSGIARRRPEIRPASLTLTRFVSCRLLLDRSETQIVQRRGIPLGTVPKSLHSLLAPVDGQSEASLGRADSPIPKEMVSTQPGRTLCRLDD